LEFGSRSPHLADLAPLRRPSINARRAALKLASALAMAFLVSSAYADSLPPAAPGPAKSTPIEFAETTTPPSTGPAPNSAGPFGFLGTSWQSPNMLGDMWGLRPALDKYGITLMATENAEVLGNLTGGVKQGFEVNDLTTATLQLDAKQPFGLDGGLFNVSGLHIWGGDVSATNLDTLQFATGIEANNTV
jgi:porin